MKEERENIKEQIRETFKYNSEINYKVIDLLENTVSLMRDGKNRAIDQDIRVASEEMLLFYNKAKSKYGIYDPIESFLIWMSIISKRTIGAVLKDGINYYLIDRYIKKFRREDEDGFLEPPSENIQKAMGGLPLVDCALAKYINGISENLLTQARETMGEIIEKNNSKIFLDISKSMTNLLPSDIRRLAFLSSILLEFMKSNDSLPIVLYGNWKHKVEKIEGDKGKRKFWSNLGEDTYCADPMGLPFKGLPFALEDTIKVNEDKCITIISSSLKGCDKVDRGIKHIKNGEIITNVAIIDEIFILNEYIEYNKIIQLIARANRKNKIFAIKENRLVEITEEVRS